MNDLPSPLVKTIEIAPLLRPKNVIKYTGLGRSTIYRMVSNRTFPTPVRLSPRTIGWKLRDVEDWEQGLPPATIPVTSRRPR